VRVLDDRPAAGSVASLAAGGVALLHPQEQVFAAMLTGWRNQQLARRLAFNHPVRREALSIRAEVRDHRHRPVAAGR